jgi:biotin transport system substrate-specific component
MPQIKTTQGPAFPTALEVWFPLAVEHYTGVVVVAMTLLIALCAQLYIKLPFTPVPITGSTLGVLYAGALLGPRRGSLSVLLYLLLGAVGLPFFVGGASGWSHFLGSTGGYLAGFVPAAWITGRLAQRGWDRSPFTALAMMLVGSLSIFACGLTVLAFYVPAKQLLALGFYPFIIGDIAKSCFSAALLPSGWKLLGK